MAAKDYEFYPAALTGQVYLAKKTKTPHLMSKIGVSLPMTR